MRISFIVPGTPIAKGRPKFAKRGAFVKVYTPEKTANYETLVGWYARSAKPDDIDLLTGPLKVEIHASIEIPSSWSKTKRVMALNGDLNPTTKPDLDNLAKGVLDAMNGIIYVDDKQVVSLECTKRYSTYAGVWVIIEPVTI